MSVLADPQTERRVATAGPVGVVDIGSNSVRLVVYDGTSRVPVALYNEKAICELGHAVALTGRLDDAAVAMTVEVLARFRFLADQMRVTRMIAVATAAAREATNGRAFIRAAEAALGAPVRVLTGVEEARLSAAGVLSGMPRADGVVGDLGGGSLELVEVNDGKAGEGESAPIGTLRLRDAAGSPKGAVGLVDEALAGMALPGRADGRALYLVGGTWRALARVHMAQESYPLHIIDHYEIAAAEALQIARLVRGLSGATLKSMPSVSGSRVGTLPYGALVLERLVVAGKPSRVVFSANGLREGLFDGVFEDRQSSEAPLVTSVKALARDTARSLAYGAEFFVWSDSLFLRAEEDAEDRRLREAASYLCDIAWRAHPDYRAQNALDLVVQASLIDASHADRVFLALSAYSRHTSRLREPAVRDLLPLVSERAVARARILGAAMRLGHVLSASTSGVLARCPLSMDESDVVLRLPADLAHLASEIVDRRLASLAEAVGRSGRIEAGAGDL